MSARSRVDAVPWWRRALRPLPVGFRPPPERLVSLMLLWDGDGWLVQSGIGVGSEPVWQRHGSRAELVAMLAEGLGVSWTEAHTDVRALDPGTTLAEMAGHDGSVAHWVQSCQAGVRGFTVSLDVGTGLVARLRPVDLMAGPPAGAPVDAEVFTPSRSLGTGDEVVGGTRVDARARSWVREVERWDLVARPWLTDTAEWLNAGIGLDWRLAAWWLPRPDSLLPRRPLLVATTPDRVDRFLDGEPTSSTAAATAQATSDGTSHRPPGAYGLLEPHASGRWFLLAEWDPGDAADDRPVGVLGLVRSDHDGLVEIRCYYWALGELGEREAHPMRVSASGRSIWYLSGREVVRALLRDAVTAGGVPETWTLAAQN